MKMLIVLLAAIFLFFQYRLWVDKEGVSATVRLKHAIAKQAEKNRVLINKNKILAEKVKELKHTRAAIETLAREEIGMIKEGETYYQIIDHVGKKNK